MRNKIFLVWFKTLLGQSAESTNKNQWNVGHDSCNSSAVMKSDPSKHSTELYGSDSAMGTSLF
jgi:hypothetical protein